MVVTSLDLSITGLASQQGKAVLTGVNSNWPEAGGPDATIEAIVRHGARGGTEVLSTGLGMGRDPVL